MSMINLLNISRNALASNQYALGITSSNISNVNTPGYSRQRPIFNPQGSTDVKGGNISVSVKITEVQRIYDNFLELQVIGQTQIAGYSKERRALLERVEMVFEESQGGRLNDTLNRFWQAWGDLSANPSGWVERHALLSVSETLTQSFRDYDAVLAGVKRDVDGRISDSLQKINQALSGIADINTQVQRIAKDEGDANQLRDQRTQFLKDLAGYLSLDYLEDERGMINVYLSNGRSVVNGIKNENLQLDINGNIVLQGQPEVILNETITKGDRGQLGAMLKIRDQVIPEYAGKLDQLAASLVEAVNAQHRVGFDQGGNTGVDFFFAAGTARDMRMNINDPGQVAASLTVNNDGGNARVIAAVKDALVVNGSSTISQFLVSLLGQVGLDLAEAKRMDDHKQLVLNNIQQRREELSGVSIDEEMMNLMKYQLGYNAAGRMLNTANELLETLIRLGA